MQPNRPVAVNLKRKIKIGNTWTFVPVARKNDRYLPDQVLIAGVATKVTEGTFYVEWCEDGYLRAGLNCGTCEVVREGKPTTCASVPQCCKCGLHMFRHTFGTNHLRAGLTLMDVSKLLGHQDVATTQVYLHQMENEDLREQVLQSSLGTMYTPDEFKPVAHKRIHVVSDEARKRMSEGGRKGGLQRVVAV